MFERKNQLMINRLFCYLSQFENFKVLAHHECQRPINIQFESLALKLSISYLSRELWLDEGLLVEPDRVDAPDEGQEEPAEVEILLAEVDLKHIRMR